MKIVTSGAGAAAIVIVKLLLSGGFKNIIMTDRTGAIYAGREGLNWIKEEMAKDAIIFACANPTPEIFPEDAKAGGAAVIATGRSDFPNQINNVLAFPGIFRGTFDVRASDITEGMKVAVAEALANLISDEELSAEYIIPAAFDERVGPAVAKAVAEAARKDGVARI